MLGLHLFYFDKIQKLIGDQSIPSIQNMNHFIVIAILFVYPMLTTAVSPDLNTQQVFSSSELPSDVEIFSNYTFKMMVRPEECSYSNLTNCHFNDMHFSYHLQCYSEVCPKERYYCLDKPNDNTVHICGKADKCHKRGRNIAVTTPKDMENIIVYSIPCRPGYAQMNSVNCFSPCEKDDSIIARATAGTDGKRALARCHAEEGYCNKKRITYFQIGSSEDECVVAANDDLGIRCEKTEDLMPDCSCTTKCKSNEERDWHESLMCKPKEEIPVTENAHSVETSSVTDKITPPENESFSEHQTPSYERESIQPEKDKEKDKADNESNNLGAGVYIAIFVLLGMLFVSIVYVIIKLKRNSDKRGVVTLLKKEFVNNQFNIHKPEDMKVNFESSTRSSHDSLLRNQKIDNMDTPKANDRVAQEPSYEEQMMLNLKIPPDGQNVSDSGMFIEDETTAKRQDGETQKDAAKLVQ